MYKGKITLLRNLKEGDKFQFCDQTGKIKSHKEYYVEGQYPKFGCTTVFAEMYINHFFSGRNSNVNCKNVTGVEDKQYVKVIDCGVLHVSHELHFGEGEDC